MPKKVRFVEQELQGLCTTPKSKSLPLPRLDSSQWLEIQKQYRFLMSTLRVAYSSDCRDQDTKIIRILRSARETCVTEIVSILQENGVPSTSMLEAIKEPHSPLATQSVTAPLHPAAQTKFIHPSPPAERSDPTPPSPVKQIDPVPRSCRSKQSDSTPLSPTKPRDSIPPSPSPGPVRQSGPASRGPRQTHAPTQQIKTTTPTRDSKQTPMIMTTSAHLPDSDNCHPLVQREVQIYHRLCSGSENLLRFPLSSKNPFELLLSREPFRPATKPRMAQVTLVYPPLEAWPVVASNGAYVTVEDVLFVIHRRRDMFPPNTLFNGLSPAYGGEYFLVLISDG